MTSAIYKLEWPFKGYSYKCEKWQFTEISVLVSVLMMRASAIRNNADVMQYAFLKYYATKVIKNFEVISFSPF